MSTTGLAPPQYLCERVRVQILSLGRTTGGGWLRRGCLGPLPRRRGSALALGCGRSGRVALLLARAAVLSTGLRVHQLIPAEHALPLTLVADILQAVRSAKVSGRSAKSFASRRRCALAVRRADHAFRRRAHRVFTLERELFSRRLDKMPSWSSFTSRQSSSIPTRGRSSTTRANGSSS